MSGKYCWDGIIFPLEDNTMGESTTPLNQLEFKLQNKKTEPFLYEVGQKVRVSKWVTEDRQTPKYWAGALAHVLRRYDGGLFVPKHFYDVKMLHGDKVCVFKEDELDRRYIRKNLDKR